MAQSAPPPVNKAAPRWSVGTLTYTSGALVVLFAWLLMGDFAWNARERTVIPLAQIMLKSGGASDALVGLLVGSLPAAMGMFISPIIGFRSDRFRSRFGRRIPFLLVSTPIATLSMAGVAFSSILGEWAHHLLGAHSPGFSICFLTIFSFFWLIFEISAITGNNLFIALINDVVPAPLLGRFFGLFRIVSLGVGIGFNFFLMGKAESHLLLMFLCLAAIYGIGFSLMCFKVKEGTYAEPPPSEARSSFLSACKQYIRECFFHPYYRWLFGVSALAIVAFAPVNTFSIFYAKSVNMDLADYGKALAVGFILSVVISYPVGALADRIHPLRVAIAALLLYVPLCFWGAFYATTAKHFGIGFIAHVVITGIYFTGTASLGQRLYPKQTFAQFASAAQVILGLFTMLVPPLMGFVLDRAKHHYPLTFLIGGLLSSFAIVGFLLLLRQFNRLGGSCHYIPPTVNPQ